MLNGQFKQLMLNLAFIRGRPANCSRVLGLEQSLPSAVHLSQIYNETHAGFQRFHSVFDIGASVVSDYLYCVCVRKVHCDLCASAVKFLRKLGVVVGTAVGGGLGLAVCGLGRYEEGKAFERVASSLGLLLDHGEGPKAKLSEGGLLILIKRLYRTGVSLAGWRKVTKVH
jgi:hypothetical protein